MTFRTRLVLATTVAVVVAVLVASTDHEELVRLCHRVLILRRGRIADEVSGGRMDHDLITAATIGRDQADAT